MNQHELLTTYVDMLVQSDMTSLIIKGNGGIGKSFVVIKELNRLGLKEGINYKYISGHMTPLKLFETIMQSVTLEAPKLLIFDDIDSLITNKTSIALLKASLWGVNSKRTVTYSSNSRDDSEPVSIDFEGKVLLILNDLKQERTFGKPLLDRCVTFDMTLSHKELIEYIDVILPDIQIPLKLETKKEIWQQIKIFSTNERFSVRSVVKAFQFYKYDKKTWVPLFINSLKLNPEQKVYYEVVAKGNQSRKQQAKEWAKKTGQTTRSFYRQNK